MNGLNDRQNKAMEIKKSVKKDLTTGPVLRNLVIFSIPLILSNVLQAVYNVADMAIAGHFVGPDGMAAINTSGQIMNVVLMLMIGFSNATNVVTGQLVGAGKKDEVKKVVQTGTIMFVGLALLIIIVLTFLNRPLLNLLQIPDEIFADAKNYLIICLVGTVFVYVYNTLAAVLRGIGDSFHPMLFVIISTVVNIILDALFMGVFKMGTAGAALATILSQALSMSLVIIHFIKNTEYGWVFKDGLGFDKKIFKMIFKIGFPQACQFSMTQISLLVIAGMVNVYGVIVAAAVGASNKAGTFAQLPSQALNMGVLTITAQNLPVQNHKRILKTMFWAIALGFIVPGCFFAISVFSPQSILAIFTSDTAVIEAGKTYLLMLSIGFIIENIIFTTNGVVSGAGYTTITMCVAFAGAAARLLMAILFTGLTDWGYYSLGAAAMLSPLIPAGLMVIALLSGKWKVSAIQKEISK